MLYFLFKIIYSGFRIFLFFILLALVWRWIRPVLRSYLEHQKRNHANRKGTPYDRVITGTMVRDPVCGTHVASELAVRSSHNGSTVFFCSEDCRRAYLKK